MSIYYSDDHTTLHHGTALAVLQQMDTGLADCIVTSPPFYGLRDYGHPDQYGLEDTPAEYVNNLRILFAEARRVLADDGTLWLNLGDTYAGKANGGPSVGATRGHSRPQVIPKRLNTLTTAPYKSLLGLPWRVALTLIDDGWILRNEIVWAKANGMPESVTDRFSNRHEKLFLLSKSPRYWFDLDPIREPHSEQSLQRAQPHRAQPGRAARNGQPYDGVAPAQTLRVEQMIHPRGRNPGDVWNIPTAPFSGAHFAVMPVALAEKCILAGCRPSGTVLDPFSGSGTTGLAAARHGRRYVGVDLSGEYLDLSLRTRLAQPGLDFEQEPAQ